jgi:hypothetical protein
LIAIGAALLLIYYSKKPGSGAARAKRVQATVVPEKRYKRSEDGKVVYLFDDDAPGAPGETERDAHPADGSDPGTKTGEGASPGGKDEDGKE